MKKSVKRIFAVVLAVVMVALMVPFSASAAVGTQTLTLQCANNAFTFDVYQLATIDTATGAVDVKVFNTDVANAIKLPGNDANTAALIRACDVATSGLGDPVATYDATEAQKVLSVDTGIYYIKANAKGFATKANSSIAVVTTSAVTVNLASKVATDDVSVTKEISKVRNTATTSAKEKAVATAGLGDVIEYTLTAKVPNTAANPLKSYVIKDEIEAGLTVEMNSIAVSMGDVTLVEDTDYTVKKGSNGFDVALATTSSDKILDKFYGKTITVKFTAKVNKYATSGTDSNDNEDSVVYQFANKATPENVSGEKVQVFTFLIQLTKVDAADNSVKLAGAVFQLKSGDNVIKEATSNGNGIVDFGVQLNAGTYTVVETKAPANYVLNSTPITVVIAPTIDDAAKGAYSLTGLTNGAVSTGVVGAQVQNTKVTVPATGGMGTGMFTLVGAILIAAAGVMFILLKRKSTVK